MGRLLDIGPRGPAERPTGNRGTGQLGEGKSCQAAHQAPVFGEAAVAAVFERAVTALEQKDGVGGIEETRQGAFHLHGLLGPGRRRDGRLQT